METGVIAGVAVCSACVLVVLLALGWLLWRLWRKRKNKWAEYEQIAPAGVKNGKHGSCVPSMEAKAAINATLSMRTIPFQVPATSSRRQDPRVQQQQQIQQQLQQPLQQQAQLPQQEDVSSNGSEPSSPLHPAARDVSEPRGAWALGSIDPSLYRMTEEEEDYDFPDGHLGRIWFAVEYERESEKLLVTLMRARNLPSRAMTSSNGCDPFIRIYLMPDERRYLQSKFKKKSCNPNFEESFVFQVSNRALEERKLRLTVFDVDRHRRHNVIGHAIYPLKEHNYDSNERVVVWRDLEREVSDTPSDRGEVNISLCYNNHLERLTVGVFEGKNFQKSESFGSGDFYLKISLLHQSKIMKTKKTEVVKRTVSPAFNESFTFKMSINYLDTASVTVAAMQHATGQRDKLVGRVVMGSFMFARGKELEHWNEMMANQRQQVTQWHILT